MKVATTADFLDLAVTNFRLQNFNGSIGSASPGRIWLNTQSSRIMFNDGSINRTVSVLGVVSGLTLNSSTGDVGLGGGLSQDTQISGSTLYKLDVINATEINLVAGGTTTSSTPRSSLSIIGNSSSQANIFSAVLNADKQSIFQNISSAGTVATALLSRFDEAGLVCDGNFGISHSTVTSSFEARISAGSDVASLDISFDRGTSSMAVALDSTGTISIGSSDTQSVSLIFNGSSTGNTGKPLVQEAGNTLVYGYPNVDTQTFFYGWSDDWAQGDVIAIGKISRQMEGKQIVSATVEVNDQHTPTGGAATFRIIDNQSTPQTYTSPDASLPAGQKEVTTTNFNSTTLTQGDMLFIEIVSVPATPPKGGHIILSID
jgi:hypothetical protein